VAHLDAISFFAIVPYKRAVSFIAHSVTELMEAHLLRLFYPLLPVQHLILCNFLYTIYLEVKFVSAAVILYVYGCVVCLYSGRKSSL